MPRLTGHLCEISKDLPPLILIIYYTLQLVDCIDLEADLVKS